MEPTAVSGWVQTIGNVIDALSAHGVVVNLPVVGLTIAAMIGVKALDRRLYAEAGKPTRGANKKHNGYLVGFYPLIATALGGLWGGLAWLFVDGGTFLSAVWWGLVNGLIAAAIVKVVTSIRAFGPKA